jgi:hypothetical protein
MKKLLSLLRKRSPGYGYKVMQIEVSNFCSLSCVYCPHPTQVRPKGDMSLATFEKCMTLVERSENPTRKGRKLVWLNHFGEPLLNPMLPSFIAYANERNIEVSFSSNGVDHNKEFFSRDLWQQLASAGLRAVCLSAHSKTAKALREHVGDIVQVIGVWEPKAADFHDWAGQVDMSRFELDVPEEPVDRCDYSKHNMIAVTWDGRVAACCYDIEAGSITIEQVLEKGFSFREISLCATCKLGRGDLSMLQDLLEPKGGATAAFRRKLKLSSELIKRALVGQRQ